VGGAELTAALASAGVHLPDRHRLITFDERPDVVDEADRFGSSVWPEFMHHDREALAFWSRMTNETPEYQLALLDPAGCVGAVARSMPLAWDRSLEDLPRGWDEQFERSVDQLDRAVSPDTLGALMIVSAPDRRGTGLAVRCWRRCRPPRG
jgi:hypothetical protein